MYQTLGIQRAIRQYPCLQGFTVQRGDKQVEYNNRHKFYVKGKHRRTTQSSPPEVERIVRKNFLNS